jgi:hypothetical protein
MYRISYTASLSIASVVKNITSIALSHAADSVYPQFTAVFQDMQDALEVVDIVKNATSVPVCNIEIKLFAKHNPTPATGTDIVANTYLKSIKFNNALLLRVNTNEERAGTGATISAMPGAAFSAFYNYSFDGITNLYNVNSGKYLIGQIMAAYNATVAAALKMTIDTTMIDFIPTIAPRFINMSYMDMMRQVAESRGLMIKVGFDNIIRVGSYFKPQTSNITVGLDDVASNTTSFDSLWQLIKNT